MLLLKYYCWLLLISLSYSLAFSKIPSEPAEYDKECFDKLFPSKSISVNHESLDAALVRVVQKQDFTGSTGEDHFIISDEVYEITSDGEKVVLEFEQDNLSHFGEINPRFLTMELKSSELNAAIGMLVRSDIDSHRKQNWTECHSTTVPIENKSDTSKLLFNEWTLEFWSPYPPYPSGWGTLQESLEVTIV